MSSKSCLFCVVILLLVLQISPSQTHLERTHWGDIKRISNDSAASVIPQVISVGDTIHLMWVGIGGNALTDSGWGVNYSRSLDGGITFSAPKVIIPPENVNKYPHLGVSKKYIYIVYLATVDSPVYAATAILRSTNAGESWEPSRVIKDYDPWCVAAKDSHLYIHGGAVYDNKYYNTMLFSSDYGLTWDTSFVTLFRGPNVARFAFTKNAMHLVRSIGVNANREIYYNRSIDQGRTWSNELIVSSNDSIESQNPRIAANDSSVYISWNDRKYGGFFTGTIVAKRSTDEGLTWENEQSVSQKSNTIFADISVRENNCAIVWDTDENNIGSIEIRISINGGNSFESVVTISDVNHRPGEPSVFVDQEKIHVAWWNTIDTDIYYRSTSIISSVLQNVSAGPTQYILSQNFPNPFNPVAHIEYFIPIEGRVLLKVYNSIGQEVSKLIDEQKDAGTYQVTFNGSQLSSGVYFYRLEAGSISIVKRMILVK